MSLTRGPLLPAKSGAGSSSKMDKGFRAAALQFLSNRPRWPGAAQADRMIAVEAELEDMSFAERAFLEIEMREKDTALHTFDYDPLALGRL